MAKFQRQFMSNEHSSENDTSQPGQKQVVVCSLAAVPEIVASTKASALVSVLHPELIPETPATIEPNNHFKLAIDDIEAPFDGLQHAESKHVEALLAFVRAWYDKRSVAEPSSMVTSHVSSGPLVVHCYAGISRSTAAAFVALCALNPKADEFAIANYIRSCSATAAPNQLIVSLGDAALGRQGRMTKAIRAIDRSLSYEPPHPFALQTNFGTARKSLFPGSKAA